MVRDRIEDRRDAPRFALVARGLLSFPSMQPVPVKSVNLSIQGAGVLHEDPIAPIGCDGNLMLQLWHGQAPETFEASVQVVFTACTRMGLRSGLAFTNLSPAARDMLGRALAGRTPLAGFSDGVVTAAFRPRFA